MPDRLSALFGEAAYQFRAWGERLWILIRDRPFLRCPACEGSGAAAGGCYEPAEALHWECWHCSDSWEEAEDHYMEWAIGRIDPLQWPRAKLSAWRHAREEERYRRSLDG